MLRYRIVEVTPFQQNCTLLWSENTGQAAIIDPGGDVDRILDAIRETGIEPLKILLTHGHADHIGGTAELSRRLKLPIEGPHRDDGFLLESLPIQCELFQLPRAESFATGRWLIGGDRVRVGDFELKVIHCPGHTPGHVVFFSSPHRLAQVGDVLFRGSIGRTDFPRGNHRDLLDSIRTRLFPLGDDVQFIPGHGPVSTFGTERISNPFVKDTVRSAGQAHQ
jgi:glyoxylase-like metal-dependent hydrolase (beta-lactamase superfamily II)